MTLVYIYLVRTQQIVDITKCQTCRYLYILCTKLMYLQHLHMIIITTAFVPINT